VVTREELGTFLWPDGEHIDHDHAINRAINSLRMVLRDSSRKARFVETVPKCGYYFAAPVTMASAPSGMISAERAALVVPPEPLAAQGSGVSEPSSALEVPASGDSVTGLALNNAPEFQQLQGPERVTKYRVRAWRRLRRPKLLLTGIGLVGCIAFLAASGLLFYRAMHPRNNVQAHVLSLGIAPLETQGEGADRLGESFRVDLMDTLSQLPSVQLRASHSLDTLKRDAASIREVSSLLNLDLLLIGKLRIQGKMCHLEFELVRGSDAVHLASFEYSGSPEELGTIRDKVQRDIFRTLATSAKSVQAARGSTENPKAYDDYLTARELAYRRTSASLEKSIAIYKSAIQQDRFFARAYAGMATAHLARFEFTNAPADEAAAKVAANKALELNPDLAEAHAILGILLFRKDWNIGLGGEELRKAIALEPQQAMYHAWLAEVLVLQGRFDEALREMDLAHADDPLWPQLFNIEVSVAGAARDYPRAIRAANRYLEMSPDSTEARDQLAWSYFGERRYEDCIAQWRQMSLLEKDPVRLGLEEKGLKALRKGGIEAYGRLRLATIAKAREGKDGDALALRAAIERHPNDFSSAEWHAFLGEKEIAMSELTHAVAAREEDPLDFAINPMFDKLHQDPQFLDLLAHDGLRLPTHYLGPVQPEVYGK